MWLWPIAITRASYRSHEGEYLANMVGLRGVNAGLPGGRVDDRADIWEYLLVHVVNTTFTA
jgi:hypothetical protein